MCLRDFQAILRQFDTCIEVNILFIQNICLVCGSAMFVLKTDFKFFCKGCTWNSKTGESLKVIFEPYKSKNGLNYCVNQ